MSSLKPITLYSHVGGPNPWKVAIILEELGVPYHSVFPKVKEEPFLSINPNGRAPAIEDPNTGITLWESGAIITYLIDQYDKGEKISYKSTPEKYLSEQWLAFQISGQGPYFGQAVWFKVFHPEKIPSAVQRYANEIERVTSVLDAALQKSEYLVGDKCTYADLAFVTWAQVVQYMVSETPDLTKYKKYSAWLAKLQARESVKKIAADQAKAKETAG